MIDNTLFCGMFKTPKDNKGGADMRRLIMALIFVAFGCNVGAMFSGISTGSLHGWIWLPMAFMGTLVGLRVRRRLAF